MLLVHFMNLTQETHELSTPYVQNARVQLLKRSTLRAELFTISIFALLPSAIRSVVFCHE
jgi:hypothetical protein